MRWPKCLGKKPGQRRTRVTMLLRASARNHPRVGKEAATLIDAGCRVVIVSVKLPGESQPVERLGNGSVVVRTATGLLQRLRAWLRRPAAGAAATPRRVAASTAPALSRRRLTLMLISRQLLAIKLAALALRTQPDVIHAHDFSTLPAAWLASALRRVPLVYDAHEVNVGREGYYRQLVRIIGFVEGCLIRRCDRVLTTTAIRARHFRRVYKLAHTPVVLQNRPPARPRPEPVNLRDTLGIPADALLCLYQGGLQEGRGLHNLLRAVVAAENVHLVLLGGGHQESSLRLLAAETTGADRIHFYGQVPLADVAAITGAADVGVQVLRNTCFNHWSTDSNKLFEYAQAGIPVVASDFPEIRRIVRQYDFGVLVNPHSQEDIVQALLGLRDDPQRLAELQRNAVMAAPHLTWQSEAPALLDVYRQLGLVRAS
jgi:glycosyltransferase involved in cell wall biosynthesis